MMMSRKLIAAAYYNGGSEENLMPEARIEIRPGVYDVHDWNCVEMTRQSIVYRPSSRTLLRRFGNTLFALVLIALMTSFVVYFRNVENRRTIHRDAVSSQQDLESMTNSLRENMTQTEWDRIQESVAQQRAEREARQREIDDRRRGIGRAAFNVYLAFCVLIGALGILSPLSALWNRVSIEVVGRNRVAARSRGIATRTREMTIERDTRMSVRAMERVARRRHAGIVRKGYRWTVRLEPAPSLAMLGGTIQAIDFEVDHQRDRPVEGMPLPPRVRHFIEGLERMTGLVASTPETLGFEASHGFFGTRGRMVSNRQVPFGSVRVFESEPQVSSRTMSFDEMPTEMRAQLEAFRSRAGAGPDDVVTAEVISRGGNVTFRDQDGAVRTYTSIDEMPEDIRALFEMMRDRSDGG